MSQDSCGKEVGGRLVVNIISQFCSVSLYTGIPTDRITNWSKYLGSVVDLSFNDWLLDPPPPGVPVLPSSTFVFLIDRGLGGGAGRFCLRSFFGTPSSNGNDKFFSKPNLTTGVTFDLIGSSPKGNFPSDLDRRCVGTGGGRGLWSKVGTLVLLVGSTGAARFRVSGTDRRSSILFRVSSKAGFGAGGGGGWEGGLLRLTDEQRTGNGGGESSGPDVLVSFL